MWHFEGKPNVIQGLFLDCRASGYVHEFNEPEDEDEDGIVFYKGHQVSNCPNGYGIQQLLSGETNEGIWFDGEF